MKTAKEIVEEINKAKIDSVYMIEDIIDMKEIEELDTINRKEHRWYSLGTVVFKIGDEYFGVHGPIHLNSESMSYCDIGYTCEAFEMEAISTTTYVYVKKQ